MPPIVLTRAIKIEFPSILLPAGISSGSIVDIRVSRNVDAEAEAQAHFSDLQNQIYNLYGVRAPAKPVLKVRNATQTSIVLEWDPIDLATATLRNLTLYRNNAKAGAIPNPTSHTSTKISGLAVDTEYTFHLVLRTSAGTLSSDKVTVRTHKMTDLSGITVCPGIMPAETRAALEGTLERIGAKPLQDAVRIDTTHFVCTEGRGPHWERAQEMNIPVVRPEWLEACEHEGRIVVARQFYLGADISKVRMSLNQRPTGPQSPRQSIQQPTRPATSPSVSQAVPGTENDRTSERGISPAIAVKRSMEDDKDDVDGGIEKENSDTEQKVNQDNVSTGGKKTDENFVSVQL